MQQLKSFDGAAAAIASIGKAAALSGAPEIAEFVFGA
jgi:hypothetical protein